MGKVWGGRDGCPEKKKVKCAKCANTTRYAALDATLPRNTSRWGRWDKSVHHIRRTLGDCYVTGKISVLRIVNSNGRSVAGTLSMPGIPSLAIA
jgi:hypothetical protein